MHPGVSEQKARRGSQAELLAEKTPPSCPDHRRNCEGLCQGHITGKDRALILREAGKQKPHSSLNLVL